MTDPNLDLFIQKITPPGQASLVFEYPGVINPEDIFDDSGNVIISAGTAIGAQTVDPEPDIRKGLSNSLKYGTIAVISTSLSTFNISEPQNIIVITSGSVVVLPSHAQGIRITIKSNNASGIVTVAGGTIDGATGLILASQYDFVEVVSDGTAWFKVASS